MEKKEQEKSSDNLKSLEESKDTEKKNEIREIVLRG